jgi:hypothetical protein
VQPVLDSQALRSGLAARERILDGISTLSTKDAATFDGQHSICKRELATETAGPSAFSKQTVDSGGAYRRYVAQISILHNDVDAHVDTLITNKD